MTPPSGGRDRRGRRAQRPGPPRGPARRQGPAPPSNRPRAPDRAGPKSHDRAGPKSHDRAGPKSPDRAGPKPFGDRGRPSPPSRRHAGGLGGEQVEGRQAVRELLTAGRRRVREVWVADGTEGEGVVAEIVARAQEGGVPLRRVVRGRIDAAAGTEAPQGVLAFADPVVEADLEHLARGPAGAGTPHSPQKPPAPAPFLVVLDGVTDPHNLGALLRTATCAGATGMVVGRHRSAHLSPAAVKAAAGAVEHLPIAVVPGIPAALGVLRAAGVWTVGFDAGAEADLWALPVSVEAVAVVLGAEGRGLSRLAAQRCDLLVSIPLSGPLSSLNVAAAGALACFEVARRRATDAG